MMGRSTNLSVAGAVKPAGATAEGGLLAALGLFFTRFGGRRNAATQGARQVHHSNLTELRAPKNPDPRWPHGWWILPGAILGTLLWILLGVLIGEVIWAGILWVIE